MKQKVSGIQTNGPRSPGYVGRDYVENTIIIQNNQKSRRKKWLKLEILRVPLFKDSDETKGYLVSQLLYFVYKTKKDLGYSDFVCLVSTNPEAIGGKQINLVTIISHEFSFINELRNHWRHTIDPT